MTVEQPVKKKPHQAPVQPPLEVPNSSPIDQCPRFHQVENSLSLKKQKQTKKQNIF